MASTKLRTQLSIVSERASVYLERAKITLTRLQKSAAVELMQVCQHCEGVFRKLRASSREALIVANEHVARLGSELSSASRKAIVQAQLAQEMAAAWRRDCADKVQRLRRESETELRKLGTGCHDAIVATEGKIAGLGSQVSLASKQVARDCADKAQKLRRESETELRKLGTGCHDAIVATEGKIAGLGSQVSVASKQVALEVRKAQDAVIDLARNVADKPRRTREARQARENDLRCLLADSLDPVVVTDSGRRLVAANAKALELFGISEFNFGHFTLDTFVPNFDWSDLSFESRGDQLRRCKIRRLDGGLRVAECQFVSGIVPRRYLYKFLRVAPYKIAMPEFGKGTATAASLKAVKPSNSGPNATVSAAKTSRPGVRPVF
jgi:PAS domain-containing protein